MRKIILIFINCFLFFTSSGILHARLCDEDLGKKKEGFYVTGLPLVNYSSDFGVGYGLRLYLYNNGSRTDTDFTEIPYKTQVYFQYYSTTQGMQYHELNIDAINALKTNLRVKTSLVIDKRLNMNYYGIGAKAIGLKDDSNREYDKYEDYENNFLKRDNYSDFKYNKYTSTAPTYFINIYKDIINNFKFLSGLQFRFFDIEPWDGRGFKYEGNSYCQTKPTLLSIEASNGIKGGWTNLALIGIAYDTRDFEPDPRKGIYMDYVLEFNNKILGSDYNFMRTTAGARCYFTPVSFLTLAGRIAYMALNGNVPFYEMDTFGFFYNRFYGLGGNRTLRGYQQDRFIGPVMTLANIEVRISLKDLVFFKQRFNFKLLAFIDTGNVYDHASDPFIIPRFPEYHTSFGGGLAIAWNLNTIIHLYYGKSREDSAVSINFGHSVD
jgi:hypothetical protein